MKNIYSLNTLPPPQKKNKFKLGDYNISWRGILGVSLLPEEGSTESFIIFMRNNTVILLKENNPYKSVLEQARILNAILSENE